MYEMGLMIFREKVRVAFCSPGLDSLKVKVVKNGGSTHMHIYIYIHTYIEHRNILEICIPKFPLLRASIHVQT